MTLFADTNILVDSFKLDIYGWSLVTGDNRLRKLAEKNGVEVHGIIWVIQKCGFDDDRMKSIFDTIHSDSTILVPEDLLQAAFPVFDDK